MLSVQICFHNGIGGKTYIEEQVISTTTNKNKQEK